LRILFHAGILQPRGHQPSRLIYREDLTKPILSTRLLLLSKDFSTTWRTMLNARALSELLTRNTDDRLCKRWFLITPNATVLAYSHPADVRDMRRNAAKAALLWQEHQDAQQTDPPAREDDKIAMPGLLRTLTLESEEDNTIIRKLRPQLLLVLEGGVPPRRSTFEPRVTPEGPDDAPYPAQHAPVNIAMGSSVSSAADSTKSGVFGGVLGLQRRKLDALAAAIAQSFEQTGFKMPDEGATKYF